MTNLVTWIFHAASKGIALRVHLQSIRLLRRLSHKESTCQRRRHGFDPWVGKILWRRKWQPTPVFLSGKSHGLAGYSLWGCKRVRHGLATTQQQQFQAVTKYLNRSASAKMIPWGQVSPAELPISILSPHWLLMRGLAHSPLPAPFHVSSARIQFFSSQTPFFIWEKKWKEASFRFTTTGKILTFSIELSCTSYYLSSIGYMCRLKRMAQ